MPSEKFLALPEACGRRSGAGAGLAAHDEALAEPGFDRPPSPTPPASAAWPRAPTIRREATTIIVRNLESGPLLQCRVCCFESLAALCRAPPGPRLLRCASNKRVQTRLRARLCFGHRSTRRFRVVVVAGIPVPSPCFVAARTTRSQPTVISLRLGGPRPIHDMEPRERSVDDFGASPALNHCTPWHSPRPPRCPHRCCRRLGQPRGQARCPRCPAIVAVEQASSPRPRLPSRSLRRLRCQALPAPSAPAFAYDVPDLQTLPRIYWRHRTRC
ncbi:hypothetical protein ACCO45_011318 [Purpureocillium lilacinum]|uniref:Uncharacterized protein n=1 Tax=Purpureocillium lilacinum TaxID=33203 RepID=A0ACC4DH85_PURLI